MNKFTLIISALMLFASVQLSAQSARTSGHISMKITDIKLPEDQAEGQAMVEQMMNSMTMDFYFKPGHLLSQMTMMGGMMTQMTLLTEDQNAMYMDMMGQKTKILIDGDADDDMTKQMQGMDIQGMMEEDRMKKTDEFKEIAGVKARKYKIFDEEGAEMGLVWISDKIDFKYPGAEDFNVNSIPLGFEMNTQGMTMVVEATSIKDLPKGAFDIDEKLYKEMTMEEYMKAMSGGGMGY